MAGAELTLHPDKTRTVDMNLADSHFDFLDYRFKRSRQGKMMRLARPKSLRKLRESIKPRTRRNNGKSMDAIVADLNRTLPGWFGYFKYVKASQLGEIDGWIRMRLRSILRKRRGLEGRGRGKDHPSARNTPAKCPLIRHDGAVENAVAARHGVALDHRILAEAPYDIVRTSRALFPGDVG